MSTQTQLRRGTSSQCDAMTPAEGEVVVDLSNDRLRIGDGIVAGGFPVPNAFDVQAGAFNTANASGTDTLTLTLAPVPSGYSTGMEITFKAANTNTTGVTINVNALGAKDIYKVSGGSIVPVIAGDIVAGAYYTIRYNGTQFQLLGASGGGVSSATGTGGIVISPTTGAVTANIDTNNWNGVGAYAILANASGFNISANTTAAGSALQFVRIQSNGTGVLAGNPTGTWRNMGPTLNNTDLGLFMKVS